MKRWEDLSEEERTPEAGLREAQSRIEEWSDGDLVLSYLKLDRIPEEIGGLTQLRDLYLYANQLTDVNELSELTQLENLYLGNNQIVDVYPLRKLKNLLRLDLGNNEVVDICPLAELVNLFLLGLDGNLIVDIGSVESLINLRTLYLSSNQIVDLRVLKKLKEIRDLDLANNNLVNIDFLSGLSNLTTLDLGYNQITDIKLLGKLTNLSKLNLKNNPICSLHDLKPLLEFGLPVFFEEDMMVQIGGINLEKCPIGNPPLEIAKQGSKAVLRYWNLTDRLGTFPNREGRVLLVGNGSSGKTSLQDKLFDPDAIIEKGTRRSTLGINIRKDLPFTHAGETYRGRIWDFGGQVEQHAIHQYFFGRRSLYIVVIDRRSEEHYDQWLRMINLLGLRDGKEETPVILLFNERENKRVPQATYNIDIYEGQYPKLKLIPYSVDLGRVDEQHLPEAEREGNDPRWPGFVDVLARELSELPVMQDILTPYAKFPERLEQERTKGRPYLDFADFGAVCQELELEFDVMWRDAANYLHAIGEVIHYGDLPERSLLRRYVIIDIVWATEAIYKVLQLPGIVKNNGSFTRKDIEVAWSDYSAEDRELLRELLLEDAFEICYRLPTGSDFDFLAPGLLPEVDKVTNWKSPQDGLFFRLRYDGPVPTGIVSRMIVRLNDLLDGQRLYRYGAVFNDPQSDLKALVRHRRSKSGANNEIEIEVNSRGGKATDFLSHLRTEFTRIHDQFFYGLKPEEVFACCCSSCQQKVPAEKTTYVYENLLIRLRAKQTDIFCENLAKNVSILDVLYGIYPEEDDRIQILLEQNKELRAVVDRIDTTTQDSNTRLIDLQAALDEVKQEIVALPENELFASRREKRDVIGGLEDLAERLPLEHQPDEAWYDAELKDKIKIGIDFFKILEKYTGVEVGGTGLKWEREFQIGKLKRPESWAEFKRWFVREE